MTEVLERWRWYVVALLAVPMLVGVGVLLEEGLDGSFENLRMSGNGAVAVGDRGGDEGRASQGVAVVSSTGG